LTPAVSELTTPQVWLVALVLAGLAPFAVAAWQASLERRTRQRTLDVMARAGIAARDERDRAS
jgi:hypothetical protein